MRCHCSCFMSIFSAIGGVQNEKKRCHIEEAISGACAPDENKWLVLQNSIHVSTLSQIMISRKPDLFWQRIHLLCFTKTKKSFGTEYMSQTRTWTILAGGSSITMSVSHSVLGTYARTPSLRGATANVSAEQGTNLLSLVPSSSRKQPVKYLTDLAQVHWFSWTGSIIHEMCHRGTPSLLRVRPVLSTAARALTFINIVWAICVAKHSGVPSALPGLYSPRKHAAQLVL